MQWLSATWLPGSSLCPSSSLSPCAYLYWCLADGSSDSAWCLWLNWWYNGELLLRDSWCRIWYGFFLLYQQTPTPSLLAPAILDTGVSSNTWLSRHSFPRWLFLELSSSARADSVMFHKIATFHFRVFRCRDCSSGHTPRLSVISVPLPALIDVPLSLVIRPILLAFSLLRFHEQERLATALL